MARLGGCVVKSFAVSIALVWGSGCASVHSSANQFADVRTQSSEQSPKESSSTTPPTPESSQGRMLTLDGLASTLIASGIITPSLKLALGRSRHEQDQGPHDFDPFNPHYTSFPSGHTTQAFAVASVIAAHYESMWVRATAFGAASIVGYARIQRNKHWATDVAAGAVIGTLVGNSVVHFNQSHRSHHGQPKISLAPLFDGEMVGIVASRGFRLRMA